MNNKTSIRKILNISLLIVSICLSALIIINSYTAWSVVRNQDALTKLKIQCPDRTYGEFNKLNGRDSFLCKLKHGHYVSAQDGVIFETGQYSYGTKVGEWKLYNDEKLDDVRYTTNSNYLAIKKQHLHCQNEASHEYAAFGPHGLSLTCIIKQGPFAVADKGKIILSGQYNMNRPFGDWTYYDQAGNIVVIKTFNAQGIFISTKQNP